MERTEQQRPRKKLLAISLAVLSLCLILTIVLIAKQFIGLNKSVEHERSVFVTQIAEQMQKNLLSSRNNHMTNIQNLATVVQEAQPETFDEVCRLFPRYADPQERDMLFFLSSDCELYGMDGVKQIALLPYANYFLDVRATARTSAFLRIGPEQEYIAYSARLSQPITIEGLEFCAIFFAWNSTDYRAALSSKLFEEKSSSLLVGTQGNIAIYPEDRDSEIYGYNLFSYLTSQGIQEEDLATLQSILAGTEDRTILCTVGGHRWLFSTSYYNELYRIFVMLPIQKTSAGTYQNIYGLIAGIIVAFLILLLMIGLVLLAAMVRQRAQREKELRAELLMKTAQAKTEFLARMSHDIRTPLNGIIGMNYLASTKTAPECTEVLDCQSKVDTAAKYLMCILNDILDMSKIESGKLSLSEEPFSLEDLQKEVISLISFQAKEKSIRLLVDVPETLDCNYVGDTLRLKQILINLLSNAVKFTDEGSVWLTITVQSGDTDQDRISFSVRDTGKGISQTYIDQLFDPFTQEDTKIATRYGGSGLGLAITKALVDMMHGTIDVTSAVGKGSEFVVTLYLKRHARVQPAAKPEVATCRFPGKRILLCEDNELNAAIATRILESYELEVDRAEDGETGVALFAQSTPWHYAMILMDVRMPQMDGHAATRAIRAMDRPDAAQIPICALSANAFDEDIRQSRDAGMNEHLAKPIDVARLSDVLKKHLEEGGIS